MEAAAYRGQNTWCAIGPCHAFMWYSNEFQWRRSLAKAHNNGSACISWKLQAYFCFSSLKAFKPAAHLNWNSSLGIYKALVLILLRSLSNATISKRASLVLSLKHTPDLPLFLSLTWFSFPHCWHYIIILSVNLCPVLWAECCHIFVCFEMCCSTHTRFRYILNP